MNNIDVVYQDLLKDILENGTRKETRNGQTISVFGRQIRHKMSEGFPLLTTKKMHWKSIVAELLWFLRGDTNIRSLVLADCNIWNGDAFSNYCKEWFKFPGEAHFTDNEYSSPSEHEAIRFTKEEFIERIKTDSEFATKWGSLGPIYGKQWRSWMSYFTYFDRTTNRDEVGTCITDQIADTIHKLKTNPDDRGIIVSAWNVGELDQMVLRPCHNFFQFYTRELSDEERADLHPNGFPKENLNIIPKESMDGLRAEWDYFNIPKRAISLMWNQRSVDTGLGLGFNIASYGLLLEIIAKIVNMVPDELIGNLGDVHLYKNHIEPIKEQLNREPFELPKLKFNPIFLANLEHKGLDEAINGQVNFELENYQYHPSIKLPLSN